MIYLMLIILAAVLAALLWLQQRQEREWLAELSRLSSRKNRSVAALPDTAHQTESQPDKQPEPAAADALPKPDDAPGHHLPFHIIDQEQETVPASDAAPPAGSFSGSLKAESEVISMEEATRLLHNPIASAKDIIPETPLLDLFDDEPATETSDTAGKQTTAAPSIISEEEATRLLHNPAAPFENEVQAVLHTPEPPKETITPDDPAILRVRERAAAEREMLDAQAEEAALAEHLAESANIPESSLPPPQVIGFDDIQANLLRQRIARHHHRAAAAAKAAADQKPLRPVPDIIAEQEVWANLSHTNTPASRRKHAAQLTAAGAESFVNGLHSVPEHGTTERRQPENTPQRFTPFTNRYESVPPVAPVYIAPPALMPDTMPRQTALPEPSFHFRPPAETELPENTAKSRQPKPSVPAIRYDEPKDESPKPWQSKPVPALAEEPAAAEESHLSEADFVQYYQNGGANAVLPENAADEWNTAWLDDTTPETSAIPEWQQWLEESQHAEQRSMIPPTTLLLPPKHNPAAVQSQEALLGNSATIEEKLAEFKVKVKVLDAYAGPVITRYEIEPDVGVRGNSVINLEKDLARALGVAAIRVVETIPGKTCMGLELPNPKRQIIRLRGIFDSPAFADSTSKLTLALGQDITGEPVVTDLAKAPHLLVAGTTGSGKSVGVNAMILSLLYKATPEDVRLIMIDPKMLELSIYEGIPHLLAPVVTDMKLAANALIWCVNEMEKRYRLMSHLGVRNLAGYNEKIQAAHAEGRRYTNPFSLSAEYPEPLEKLPFIVVVVDEFADLMMVAGKQIEQLIARLAQKARAAGIHLILATQRPSVDVITGLIKANIPTRIAFQVAGKVDSRTILDQMGAENLLGQGDMLFLPPGTGYPQRVHGAYVDETEVHAVTEYLKQFGEPDYVEDILTSGVGSDDLFSSANSGSFEGGSSGKDPLFDQAVEILMRTNKATISMLQRHLRIGYNKAATLIDQLEAEGIVSAPDHSGKRTVLTRRSEEP